MDEYHLLDILRLFHPDASLTMVFAELQRLCAEGHDEMIRSMGVPAALLALCPGTYEQEISGARAGPIRFFGGY